MLNMMCGGGFRNKKIFHVCTKRTSHIFALSKQILYIGLSFY